MSVVAIRRAGPIMAAWLCVSCAGRLEHGGWYALRWMESPGRQGPSTRVGPDNQASYLQVTSFEARDSDGDFDRVRGQLREGDLVAYRMTFWDAYRDILVLKLNTLGYRIFKYGHLAIIVQDLQDPTQLRLFSSHSFKGPNLREGLETLRAYDFDVYRLDKWDRVDRDRLNAFVKACTAKAGQWSGYDFMGMFGIANSNMRPTDPESIGRDYICSTVVVSALYYAGLELDAIQRDGMLDLVTPAQVVTSGGRLFPPPQGKFVLENGPGRSAEPTGGR